MRRELTVSEMDQVAGGYDQYVSSNSEKKPINGIKLVGKYDVERCENSYDCYILTPRRYK